MQSVPEITQCAMQWTVFGTAHMSTVWLRGPCISVSRSTACRKASSGSDGAQPRVRRSWPGIATDAVARAAAKVLSISSSSSAEQVSCGGQRADVWPGSDGCHRHRAKDVV